MAALLPSFERIDTARGALPTAITLTSGSATLTFEGTATDPLNADGLNGRAVLNAPKPKDIYAVAGAAGTLDAPLTLAGAFTHQGGLWQLSDSAGTLDGSRAKIDFKVVEGARHQPDNVTLDAAFAKLNLDPFVRPSATPPQPPAQMSLMADPDPGMVMDAHAAADRLHYRAIDAEAFDLKARVAPGALTIQQLALEIAGGSAKSRIAIVNQGAKAKVDFDGSLADVDARKLAKLLGWGKLPIEGPITSHVSGNMIGATLADGRDQNRIFALVTMSGGTIDRELVSLASTDIRLLFGGGKGEGKLSCLLAVLDLKNGHGSIAPIRIKTSDGTILGGGTYDALRDYVDLVIGTRRSTTSFFALDVPARLTGPVGDISASPAFGASRQFNAVDGIAGLPPDMQAMAKDNACATL